MPEMCRVPAKCLWHRDVPSRDLRPVGCSAGGGRNYQSIRIAEQVGKAVSTVSLVPYVLAVCAHAGFAQTVADCRATLVRGTLTRALQVGRALVDAQRAGKDTVQSAAEACDGTVLFRGTVTGKDWKDQAGYMVGTTAVEGEGDYRGSQARIWFKNENHVLWVNDSVRVTSPDLICVINGERGEPRTNTELEVGERVGVIGLAADDRLRHDPALALARPQHYGLDVECVLLV